MVSRWWSEIQHYLQELFTVGLELTECNLCFNAIPNPDLCRNYSDHVGIEAKFLIKKEAPTPSSSQRCQQLRIEKALLEKSLRILEEGEVRVLWDRRLFLALCFILCALIVATVNIETPYPFFTIFVSCPIFPPIISNSQSRSRSSASAAR